MIQLESAAAKARTHEVRVEGIIKPVADDACDVAVDEALKVPVDTLLVPPGTVISTSIGSKSRLLLTGDWQRISARSDARGSDGSSRRA